MESPPYLFDQFARSHGLSKEMAKRALLLRSYAQEGKRLTEAAKLVGIARSTAQNVARKLIIDFADYRPYEALEKKGEPRPKPFFRPDLPADALPLFGAA